MQYTGHSSPIGATVVDGGVNFRLFSRSATGVVLFAGAGSRENPQLRRHYPGEVSSHTLASCRSGASKPSVNQL
jgi:hypothetical protein